MRTCTSARGDFTCLEVQFILSRMGTGLPEEIADLVKYDETAKPNGWYVPEPWDATKSFTKSFQWILEASKPTAT